MVKITAELILRSPVVFNPLGDRELVLRGLKIPAIRNLGVTQDQFDSLDLSDNDIQVLGNFPKQTRLSTVQLNDNQISSVEGQNVADALPNLTRLILTGNQIQRLEDLDEIARITTLGKSLTL
jgi:U2 small nuclear ribonucleoprotein A'|tara:strand:- start:498 stop:866 length:369 start_codon:yes stop_codon:yes gene_type:complete